MSPANLFSSFSNNESTLSEIERMQSMGNYRELKNLGSRILDVRPFHSEERTGYQVIYNEGDPCPSDPGRKYQTHVKYQCDPDYKDNPNDFPQMVVADDYQSTATQCIFDFIWHSRFACPPCKSDQVKIHKSFCDANGVSKWHVTRNEGERCVIGHTPNSWLKQFPDFKKDEF